MYGLVCENIAAYIKHKFGKDAWENIRRISNIDSPSFSIHQVILLEVDHGFYRLHFTSNHDYK